MPESFAITIAQEAIVLISINTYAVNISFVYVRASNEQRRRSSIIKYKYCFLGLTSSNTFLNPPIIDNAITKQNTVAIRASYGPAFNSLPNGAGK